MDTQYTVEDLGFINVDIYYCIFTQIHYTTHTHTHTPRMIHNNVMLFACFFLIFAATKKSDFVG